MNNNWSDKVNIALSMVSNVLDNIKNWNTANVTDFTDAFKFCTSLKEIDGVIDMRSCKKYKDMFLGCNKLRHLKIRNAPKYFTNRCGLMINHIEFVD